MIAFWACIQFIILIKSTEESYLKMIDIVRKNKPIIIVYSNPDTIINRVKNIFKRKSANNKFTFTVLKMNGGINLVKKLI